MILKYSITIIANKEIVIIANVALVVLIIINVCIMNN